VRKHTAVFILPALFALALPGCGTCGPSARVPANDSPSKDSANKDSANKDSASKTATTDLPGLKDLDEADRKLAERQKTCPISGDLLGTSGMKIYKMTVKGRVVFLCCEGCKEDVDKDPDGTLKKIDEQMAKNK
jgi:hypothetical protein